MTTYAHHNGFVILGTGPTPESAIEDTIAAAGPIPDDEDFYVDEMTDALAVAVESCGGDISYGRLAADDRLCTITEKRAEAMQD